MKIKQKKQPKKKANKPKQPPKECVKPYNPSMQNYNMNQINAFVDQCKDWDEQDDDQFELESGENVKITTLQKTFDSDDHYITLCKTFVDGVLISQSSSLRHANSSCSSSYGDITNSENEKIILCKIGDFRKDRRHSSAILSILDGIFSPGYEYSKHVSDPSMKVNISDMVSFGDFEDAQHCKPQKQNVGGTIVGFINTVRSFHPGTYFATVIKPIEDCDPLLIYHHQQVNPTKIVDQIILMADDYCDFHLGMVNSINRYDWCEFRNWGGDCESEEEEEQDEVYGPEYEIFDEESNLFLRYKVDVIDGIELDYSEDEDGDCIDKETSKRYRFKGAKESMKEKQKEVKTEIKLHKEGNMIYFCDTEKAAQLKDAVLQGQVKKSEAIPELYQVLDKSQNCIALATNVGAYNSGDWLYGKSFQDKISKKYFALVVNCTLGELDDGNIPDIVKQKFPNRKFTTVKETNLEFNMTEFSH